MKKVLTFLLDTEEQLSHLLVMVGACCAVIFGAVGIAYMRGELVMQDGRAMLDVTTLATSMDGRIAYIWWGVAFAWFPLYLLRLAKQFRDMWRNRKQDGKQIEDFLRPVWRAIRGEG